MSNFAFAVKQHLVHKKNLYLLLAKLGISIGLLTFIIIKVDIDEILTALMSANLFYISAGILLLPVNLWLQYKKWGFTCRRVLDVNDRKKIFYSLFFGLSGGAFTPARVGEYGGRTLVLKDKSFIDVTTATFLEKIHVLIIEVFFGVIAAAIFVITILGPGNYILLYSISLFLALASIAIVISFNKKRSDGIKNFILKFSFFRKSQGLIESIFSLDKSYFIKMICITGLFYGCYILQFVFFSASISNNFNFINYIWAASLIVFSKSLIGFLSLGEIGVREGASVYILTKLGEESAVGFNAAIFIFIINILIPALFGLLLMLLAKNDK